MILDDIPSWVPRGPPHPVAASHAPNWHDRRGGGLPSAFASLELPLLRPNSIDHEDRSHRSTCFRVRSRGPDRYPASVTLLSVLLLGMGNTTRSSHRVTASAAHLRSLPAALALYASNDSKTLPYPDCLASGVF